MGRPPFFRCGHSHAFVAIVLVAAVFSEEVSAGDALAGSQQAGNAGTYQAQGQIKAEHAAQLQGLDTGFSKLLIKYTHKATTESAVEGATEGIKHDAQHAQVSTAGAYLNSLVKKLNDEVLRNEAERLGQKQMSYKDEDEYHRSEEDHSEGEARYQYQHHYEGAAPGDHHNTPEDEPHGHGDYNNKRNTDDHQDHKHGDYNNKHNTDGHQKRKHRNSYNKRSTSGHQWPSWQDGKHQDSYRRHNTDSSSNAYIWQPDDSHNGPHKHSLGDRPYHSYDEPHKHGSGDKPHHSHEEAKTSYDGDSLPRDSYHGPEETHASSVIRMWPGRPLQADDPEPVLSAKADSSRPARTAVCLKESGRSDCTAEEASNAAPVPDNVGFRSALVSCAADTNAHRKNEGVTVIVASEGAAKESPTEQQSTHPSCTWKVNYLQDPVAVAPSITQIGHGVATCRLDNIEEICGAGSCSDVTYEAKVDVYKTFAISEQPPTASIANAACQLPSPPAPPVEIAAINARTASNSNSVSIASQADRQTLYKAIVTQAVQPSIYGGEAIIMTGPLTAIGSGGDPIEYSSGALEYVASFDGRQLTALETVELAEDVPVVRANTYKVLLN